MHNSGLLSLNVHRGTNQTIAQYLKHAMGIMRAHVHLSIYFLQYVYWFHTAMRKLTYSLHHSTVPLPGGD